MTRDPSVGYTICLSQCTDTDHILHFETVVGATHRRKGEIVLRGDLEQDLLDQRELQKLISNGLDIEYAKKIRNRINDSATSIIQQGQSAIADRTSQTGLVLGHVQSGKTTSIVALIAQAWDAGFKIVIGLMGSNENLLSQNADRIMSDLDITSHGRKRWYTYVQGRDATGLDELKRNLEERNRAILILIMKNSAQIDKITDFLETVDVEKYPVLIVDDEADQVSLNTQIKKTGIESATYRSISQLRKNSSSNLYVEYTATPYANLLLTPDEHLAPDFVEVLEPGDGYTGGYEFFIENSNVVFRNIGAETMKAAPTSILPNLERALANFFAGASLMICNEGIENTEPISMLVTPQATNAIQTVYESQIRNQIAQWKILLANVKSYGDLPLVFKGEYQNLVDGGVTSVDGDLFLANLKPLFDECAIWLLNQQTTGTRVKWRDYTCHILIGGNKLERGFTVEGLTVTYANRTASDQIDTMQQRSRAFGYRPYLKYCRIFTTEKVRKTLENTVHTENDLRDQLVEWKLSGHSFREWSRNISLIVGSTDKPTRDSVVASLTTAKLSGWYYDLNPSFDEVSHSLNRQLLQSLGILDAPFHQFGQHRFRSKTISIEAILEFLQLWNSKITVEWRRRAFLRSLKLGEASAFGTHEFRLVLIDSSAEPGGQMRTRSKWTPLDGLPADQLMEGHNRNYPGDRNLFPQTVNVMQVHVIDVLTPEVVSFPLYFLAIKLNSEWKAITR